MKQKVVRDIHTGEIRKVSFEEAKILIESGYYRTSSKSKHKSQIKEKGKKWFLR